MTSSRYPQITDELLSAYIDNQVTDDEKALIEAAVVEDPMLAWQLESLRYTVELLHTLPQLALPRSFVLSDAQLLDGAVSMPALAEPARMRAATARRAPRAAPEPGGFWVGWRNFWQVGNLFLRNAAAASLAIFLVVSAGGAVLQLQLPTSAQVTIVSEVSGSAQQPTIATAAPTASGAQAVALAQTTTTQATSNAETSREEAVPLEKQVEVQASAVDGSVPPTEVTPSSSASRTPPADRVQALAQAGPTVTTDLAGGQGGSVTMPSDAARGGELAAPPGSQPGNQDLAPPEPQAQPSPLQAAMAAASVGSADSFSTARSAVVTNLVATEPVTGADTFSATVVISSSTAVSLTESFIVSAPATSSLASETDAVSETLFYSAPRAEAAIQPTSNATAGPTSESTVVHYQPSVDSNVASNPLSLLRIFQLTSALAALLLSVLWWRSRSTSPETR